MTNITTHFTETELMELGRAMERAGFTDIEEFVQHATEKLTREILNKN